MSGKRLYRGASNNGVHSFYGEATEALLERQRALAANYSWDYAWEQIPSVGPVATFIPERDLSPFNLGYVTGTMEELGRWMADHSITQVRSSLFNGVPFSNGRYVEEIDSSLSDEQFMELFGFNRPADAISTPDRRMPLEFAAVLPPFACWEEREIRLPNFLHGTTSFASTGVR